jgi:hypothetical protein
MNTNFPRGAASFLIRKSALSHSQINAIIHHMEYAGEHFRADTSVYRWWESDDDYQIDAWRIQDNYGRIFLWTAYDNFNMGRFLVKLLGPALAQEVWLDSWHSVYGSSEEDPYFERAQNNAH